MRGLTISNHNGELTTDSREVAELIGKRHSDLLESIDGYIKHLENGNFRSQDFFIESSYTTDGNKKTYKCYLVTRKGCSMIANKMTGEKGVVFTATYITRFEEMERVIKKQVDMTQLSPELQMFKQIFDSVAMSQLEQKRLAEEIKSTKSEIAAVREVIEIVPSREWRNETNGLVKKICYVLNDYKTPKEDIYKALQQRAACDLKRRLENLRARLILNGGSKSKADSLNYLDVIAEDKKLVEIYTSIVKEMAIKHRIV